MNYQALNKLLTVLSLITAFVFYFTSTAMATSSEADAMPRNWLVSLQDQQGRHLCYGSYIGNNQIFVNMNCTFYPPTLPPLPLANQSLEVNAAVSAKTEAAMIKPNLVLLPFYQAVFLLDNGPSEPVLIDANKLSYFPYQGRVALLDLNQVPRGANAITLATKKQLDGVEQGDQFQLIYYQIEKVLQTPITVQSKSQCKDDNSVITRHFCLQLDQAVCENNMQGGPILSRFDGQWYQVSFVNELSRFCNSLSSLQPSIDSYIPWINNRKAHQEGLSISEAYEFGVNKTKQSKMYRFTIRNHQNSAIELANWQLQEQRAFKLVMHNCEHLSSQSDCEVLLRVRAEEPVSYLDVLTFTINNQEAVIFLSVDGESLERINGDNTAFWRINGWIAEENSGDKIISVKGNGVKSSVMERKRPIIGPSRIKIRYRTKGSDSSFNFLSFHPLQKTHFFAQPGHLVVLDATFGQWKEKEVILSQEGSHFLNVFSSAAEHGGIVIDSICIDDCSAW